MKVVFLLPGQGVRPTGGYKVVYEYANRLTRDGHEVSVLHPWSFSPPASRAERRRARIWVAKLNLRRSRIAPWFDFEPGVRLSAVVEAHAETLPGADVLV